MSMPSDRPHSIIVGGTRFLALFQPIIRRRNAATEAHELLLRPVSRDGSPAETAGGLDRLGPREARELDTQVLRWLPDAARAGLLPCSPVLFVNIYLSTLAANGTAVVDQLARAERALGGALGLEINEDSYRSFPSSTLDRLAAAREHVSNILLDDLDRNHDLRSVEQLEPYIDGVKIVRAEASAERRGWLRKKAFRWAVCEQGPGDEPFTHDQYFDIGRPAFAGAQ